MKRIWIAAASIVLTSPVSAQSVPQRLELACMGGGSANKADVTTFNSWEGDGGQAIGTRTVGFQDQVSLWIDGGDGRIRMPRSMLPSIRGGEDGWFKIKSVSISDREITGTIAVNPLNSPKLRIDRYTGMISISGKAGDFLGHCQKYDPAIERRAF